ncbi:MAG: ABC transporter transmembrane domain-containing protein, partial [Anaeroplasmataceae bacterium]
MISIILRSLREYKVPSLLSPFFVTLEVIMECTLPFIMTMLINEIQNDKSLQQIGIYSVVLLVLAAFSLLFGILSGTFSAKAASGLAKNLREDMYKNINNFSFANIDKFHASSLVTRLTTDVTNVQNAYLMIVRVAVRAPLMLIFANIMAFIIAPNVSWIFLVMIPIVGFILVFIIYKAFPLFNRVFKKYDILNRNIQENINGIRVVKSYVREDYEFEKFEKAADDVCRDFTKAEKIVAFNTPSLQFSVYVLNVLVITTCTLLIVNSGGKDLGPGELSSLLIYGMQSLMALMMLSMVLVLIIIAFSSAKRIVEVLKEESTLTNPENPIYELKEGSVSFDKVFFKYEKDGHSDVLKDININIKPGETVGIIGGTGSAKTSLVNLIS